MKKILTPKTVSVLSSFLWALALFLAVFWFSGEQARSSNISNTALYATSPTIQKTQTHTPLISLKEALSTPSFSLGKNKRSHKIPDLRSVLLYYGTTGRPDLSICNARISFGIRGNQTIFSAESGKKIFLRYDLPLNRWFIEEKETPLSILFTPHDSSTDIDVELIDPAGPVVAPKEHTHFTLPMSQIPNQGHLSMFSINNHVVDPSLLDRFGALWYGKDCTIEKLGGKEYEAESTCERIEFHHDDCHYALFLQAGDFCIFDGTTWKKVSLGDTSKNFPLLKIETIADSSISCRIWNEEGSHQANIVLHKKPKDPQFETPKIRIIAARSAHNLTIELFGKKISIHPEDWLIILPKNEILIIDNEEILNDFIQGRIKGNLLAFSGFEKVEKEQCLSGLYFNISRTESIPLYVSMYHSWAPKESSAKASKEKASLAEEEEEEEDLDDEDIFIDDDGELIDDEDDIDIDEKK